MQLNELTEVVPAGKLFCSFTRFFSFPSSKFSIISYEKATNVTFHTCCHLLYTYPPTRWCCIVFDTEGNIKQTIDNFTIQHQKNKDTNMNLSNH